MSQSNFVEFLKRLAEALQLEDTEYFLEIGALNIDGVNVFIKAAGEAVDTGILCYFLIGEILESHAESVLTELLALNLHVDTKTEGVFACDPLGNQAYLNMHVENIDTLSAEQFAVGLSTCAAQAKFVRQNIFGFSTPESQRGDTEVSLA